MKIKVKVFNKLATPMVWKSGDWIDLRAAEDVQIPCAKAELLKQHDKEKYRQVNFYDAKIPLGVAMQLPEGFEAVVNARSSLYKKFGVVLANAQGIIDNSYCGDNDQWFAHVIALRNTMIPEGSRICQFRVQLSQKATFWQKLKWLFSSGIEFEFVDKLDNPDRGGHGSTGVK